MSRDGLSEWLTAALLLACVGAAASVYRLWPFGAPLRLDGVSDAVLDAGGAAANEPAATLPWAAAGSQSDARIGASADIGAALRRPLFNPDRRPPAATVKAPVKTGPPPRLDWSLTGIVDSAGDRFALFGPQRRGGATVWLREGEQLGAWRLIELGRRRAVLSYGNEQRTLELHR